MTGENRPCRVCFPMKHLCSAARLVSAILVAWTPLHVQEAPAQSPKVSAPQLKAGLSQLAQGLNDEAMKSFEVVLQDDPHNAEARRGEVKAALAAALQAKHAGDDDGTLVYLVRARKYVPDDPGLLFDFGVQADGMRLYKDAEEALNKSLELRPGDARTIYALGHLELDEGKVPQAEAHLREYLKLRPDDASAHYGLGKLLHMVGRNEEAKAELRRSTELLPLQTESYYELGDIELNLEHDEEAAAFFQKVLGRNPKHGGALTGMGMVAYRKKDYATAETYLHSAVLAAPDYSPAHYYHGMALARLGRKEEAEKELAQAKSLDEKQNQELHGYVLSAPTC
jgi:Flp pilus assembly protein TadD